MQSQDLVTCGTISKISCQITQLCVVFCPAALSVAAFAIAFPFYGTINAIIGAITSPLVAFAFPAAAYSWMHRTKSQQENSLRPPPKYVVHAIVTSADEILG